MIDYRYLHLFNGEAAENSENSVGPFRFCSENVQIGTGQTPTNVRVTGINRSVW